jgi:hypothetical protein
MSEEGNEGFFRRWSRVKAQAREAAPPRAPDSAAPAKPAVEEPVPELPPIDKLTFESDFRAFFHPEVDEDLRRGALRKLFSDPHFNVMDGLDVYIDDYSKSEPIPAAMLASLKQAQRILDWAADKRQEVEERADDRQRLESSDAPKESLPEPRPDPAQAEPATVTKDPIGAAPDGEA